MNEVSLLGSLGVTAREIQVHEDDGAIQFANETGLVAGQTNAIIARGYIGDGPHGSDGTGFGDYDYYKLSASAGQLISVNVEGNSLDSFFDPVAAIYDSSGELLTFNDNNIFTEYYDDLRPVRDPAFQILAPSTETYFVVVFSSFNFQSSALDSSSGAEINTEGDYHLSIALESPQLLTTQEEDGAIPFAVSTGLQPGIDGFVFATGTIGDGLYGSSGSGSGDYDVFRIDAAAGQRVIISTETDPRLHSVVIVDPMSGYPISIGLDTILTVYDEFGNLLVSRDDWDNLDAYIDFVAPFTGSYYAAVSGNHFTTTSDDYLASNFLNDPFDPSSGGLAGTEGPYSLLIKTEMNPDRDFYSIDLSAGDVLSVTTAGGNGFVDLLGPTGEIIHTSAYIENLGQSSESPVLADVGDLGFIRIVTEPGRYVISVADYALNPYNPNIAFTSPCSPYELSVRVDRPGIEQQPVYTHQVLFLDFDGASSTTLDELSFSDEIHPLVDELTPFRDYLPQYGFTLADEDKFIDRILSTVVDRLAVDVGGISGRGLNGEFEITSKAGEFQIEILNSRDHFDYFDEQFNISRVIIGSSNNEIGSNFPQGVLGFAAHIDVGNYDLHDSSFVLADDILHAVDVANIAIAPSANRLDLFADAFSFVILHEAGHNFGNWHTSPFNLLVDIMDNSGIAKIGLGPDAIYGTEDDVSARYGQDLSYLEFLPQSVNDTLNTIAYGLSTGTMSGTYFDFVTGTLYVTGDVDDGRKDELEVKNSGSNFQVYINDKLILTRPAAGVNRVVLNGSSDRDELDASHYSGPVTLFGRGGKDELKGGSNDDLLFGGDGDDELKGNSGNDVLVGGDGYDKLDGGSGADVLIGGLGADKLEGGGGDDLLIAGTTAFDINSLALTAIGQEWSSGRSYATRVANLRGTGSEPRDNGAFFLKTTGPQATVHTDTSSDKLSGNSGRDWFFAKLSGSKKDKIQGLSSDELTDLLT